MRQNLNYFLITSCTDIQLSCGNFLHQQQAFKKYVLCGERRSVKSERKQTGKGGVQAYLCVRSVKKIAWFFKKQTRFLSANLPDSC